MTFSPREKFTTAWNNAWDWVRQEVFNRQVKEDLEAIESELSTIGVGIDVYNESLAGTKNGVNLVFTTAFNYITNSTRIELNGQRLVLGADYTEGGTNVINMVAGAEPYSTDSLIIDYLK